MEIGTSFVELPNFPFNTRLVRSGDKRKLTLFVCTRLLSAMDKFHAHHHTHGPTMSNPDVSGDEVSEPKENGGEEPTLGERKHKVRQ